MGYSYFGAHGQVKPAGINYSSVNLGAIGSGAYYFNKYVGAEINVVSHNDGNNDGFNSASGGLIARAPMQNFTVFAHGLVGGARLGGPNNDSPAQFEHEPYRWGPTLTAGGGMDYDLPFFSNRFSLRLFEVDYRYVHADFGPATTVPTGGVLGGRANLSGVDLSTGIVMHFGHIIPPPPITYACTVNGPVFPGEPVTVTGTVGAADPKKTLTYTWTATGGTISGTSSTATVATTGAAPGTYTVKGHVSEGAKPGQMADCSADFTVKPFEPPTISCSASPSTVNPGDSSTITAMGKSPQNRPLTYSYSATSGSVSGTTSTATLSTSGVSGGTSVTVTCNVVDDTGKSATAMTTVMTSQPPPPPTPVKVIPQPSTLCAVSFERDKARPTRVDNEAKACLDDLALSLQRSSDATLDLTGNETPAEMKNKRMSKFAAERAVNVKAYLVTDKGIDASRIKVMTGTAGDKTVTSTLVPSGADTSSITGTAVDETTVKAIPRKAVGKKHKK